MFNSYENGPKSIVSNSLRNFFKCLLSIDYTPDAVHTSFHLKKVLTSLFILTMKIWDFPGCPVVKNLLANAEDTSSIPALGRFHMPQGN